MVPKITLCIPVYKTPLAYLECLLESIKKQTFRDFVVVITDDSCSDDFVYDELIAYYSDSFQINYLKNDKNLGMTGNWNKALSFVDTECFIFLGHDDALYPDALKELYDCQVELGASCVSSSCSYFDEHGLSIEPSFNVNYRDNIFVEKEKYSLTAREAVRLCLGNGIAFGELTCQLFRYSHGVGYSAEFNHAADLEFFLKMVSLDNARPVGYLNRKLFMRRIHSEALTEKNYILGYVTRERQMIFDKYVGAFDYNKNDIRYFKTYLLACAMKDILSFSSHKSYQVLREAFTTIGKNIHLGFSSYLKMILSLSSGKNMDAQ